MVYNIFPLRLKNMGFRGIIKEQHICCIKKKEEGIPLAFECKNLATAQSVQQMLDEKFPDVLVRLVGKTVTLESDSVFYLLSAQFAILAFAD